MTHDGPGSAAEQAGIDERRVKLNSYATTLDRIYSLVHALSSILHLRPMNSYKIEWGSEQSALKLSELRLLGTEDSEVIFEASFRIRKLACVTVGLRS